MEFFWNITQLSLSSDKCFKISATECQFLLKIKNRRKIYCVKILLICWLIKKLKFIYLYTSHTLQKLVKMWYKVDMSKNLCEGMEKHFLEMKQTCQVSTELHVFDGSLESQCLFEILRTYPLWKLIKRW